MAKFVSIGKYLGLMYTLEGCDGDKIYAKVEYSGAQILNDFATAIAAKRWALETIRQVTGQQREA